VIEHIFSTGGRKEGIKGGREGKREVGKNKRGKEQTGSR
jgi:hypothetical protein